MKEFKSVDDILDFAIENEEKAAELYLKLSEKMERPESQQLFKELYREEIKHKQKILEMKDGKVLELSSDKVTDLRISDYLPKIELREDLDYQNAITFAMQAEKAEFRLYNDLAFMVDDSALQSALLLLAQEEAKHKLKLEIEYDDYVFTEG